MPSIKLTDIEMGFLRSHYEQELADAIQYVAEIKKFLVKLGVTEKEPAAAPKKGRRGRPSKKAKAVAEEQPAPVSERKKKPGRKPGRKKGAKKAAKKAAGKPGPKPLVKAAAPAPQKATKPAAKKAAKKRAKKSAPKVAAKKAPVKKIVAAPKPAEVTPPAETPAV